MAPLLPRDRGEHSNDAVLADFARLETAQEALTPSMRYPELLELVHRRLAAARGLHTSQEADRAFGRSVGDWPAFTDSAAALAYLARFYTLVILSNVDRRSFAASNRRLGIAFDGIYTAEDIGSYKPDLRNFRYMIAALGRRGHAASAILHVAQSLYHDHAPANIVGLRSAWIDRRQATGTGATPPVAAPVHWDFRFASLAELVVAHRAELSG
jgi:2-haloacid dehalogenase